MPELPEVQSTVDYLASRVIGAKISASCFTWPNSLVTHSKAALIRLLATKRIKSVFRRAKYIVLELADKHEISYFIIHLRMSGSIEVLPQSYQRDPYDRFWLTLSNGKELRFNDVRKFGKVYYYNNLDELSSKLGIEPLSDEFNADWFVNALASKSGAIKPVLLNQAIVAGIGNIYADETLWRARLHPKLSARLISAKKVAELNLIIKQVLIEAIELKGTDSGDNVVSGGMYSPSVYGRNGQKCLRCRTVIVKIFVGQRGTHFCPKCQKV